MRRLLRPRETALYLQACQAYVGQEFGSEECIPLERFLEYRQLGVDFYQAYGDFSQTPPRILGVMNCVLIAERELQEMEQGTRRETGLDGWRPADGPAVLWVAAVVSSVLGGAAKCIAGILDQIDRSPFKQHIRKVALYCTGPQSVAMARRFGMAETGTYYREGEPFMVRTIGAGELDELGAALLGIWNMDLQKDVVRLHPRREGKLSLARSIELAGNPNTRHRK